VRIALASTCFLASVFACAGAPPPDEAGRTWADRVGVYAWWIVPRTGIEADPLAAAVKRLGILGVRRARFTISPTWDPDEDRGRLTPLPEKVQRPSYRAALCAFPLVTLTAYDLASYAEPSPLYRLERERLTELEWAALFAAVRSEFRSFGRQLALIQSRCGVSGHEIRVSNWEWENDEGPYPAGRDVYLEYLQARADGLAEGVSEGHVFTGYPLRISSQAEFTDIRDSYLQRRQKEHGLTSKTPAFPEAVLSLREVQYASYSSWRSIFHTASPDVSKEVSVPALREDLDRAKSEMAKAGWAPRRLTIGEIGFLRDHDDEQGSVFEALLRTVMESGVDGADVWVLYDQDGQGVPVEGRWVDQSKFGQFTVPGTITPQGERTRDLLRRPLKRR
jgi:hypothetical protein